MTYSGTAGPELVTALVGIDGQVGGGATTAQVIINDTRTVPVTGSTFGGYTAPVTSTPVAQEGFNCLVGVCTKEIVGILGIEVFLT